MIANNPPVHSGVTELVLQIFRANGALLQAGDRLVAPLGLTSARWQLLGAILAAAEAEPVVGLARMMGVTRQAVQRLANELMHEGLLEFSPNPRHKRAQLVVLTSRGRDLAEAALALQRPWAAALGEVFGSDELADAADVLVRLRWVLESHLEE